MPSNDDLKHQNEEMTNGLASGDATVASVLPDDQAAVADKTTANAAGINEASANEVNGTPLSSDHSVPHEFTFFQKKKRPVQVALAPSVAYASTAQVTAFTVRLDSAVAANAKMQRHIAELMTLMSGVACTMTTDVSKPPRKRLRRSKWLFYGCLVGFGMGWFLLFPSGHSLITQLAAFWQNSYPQI